jgi:flagellar hook-associated protein 2
MLSANNMTRMRLAGLNSGTDVESMVRAMGMASQMRINNNQRRVLLLQAQQNAYREVISRLQTFQRSYFDFLNPATNLRSANTFNQTRANVFTGNVEATPPGVTVSSAPGAAAATYNVRLVSNAAQARLTGEQLVAENNAPIDLAALDSAGGVHAMRVTAGGVTHNLVIDIAQHGNAQTAINEALRIFGTTNAGNGIITVDNNGNVSATDTRAISISSITQKSNTGMINFDPSLPTVATGKNSFNVQIGGQSTTVEFTTIAQNHFADLFNPTTGNLMSGDITAHIDAINAARPTGAPMFTRAEFDTLLNEFNTFVEVQYQNNFNEWHASIDLGQNAAGVFNNADREAIFQSSRTAALRSSDGAWAAFFTNNNHGFGSVEEMLEVVNNGGAASTSLLNSFDTFTNAGYLTEEQEIFLRNNFIHHEFTMFEVHAGAAPNPNLRSGAQFMAHINTPANLANEIRVHNERAFADSITHLEGLYWDGNIQLRKASDGTLSAVQMVPDPNNDGEWIEGGPATVLMSVTYNHDSANNLGIADRFEMSIVSFASWASLGALGITDTDVLNINGRVIQLNSDMSLSQLANAVNSSGAGVNMSFSAITNTLNINTISHGADAAISFTGTNADVLSKLGLNVSTIPHGHADFNDNNVPGFRQGRNLVINVNNSPTDIETTGNSYTIDGTTFTFAPHAEEGTTMRVEVTNNPGAAVDAIKSFVNSYNSLVRDITLGMLAERPGNGDRPSRTHHFLTDFDIEEMGMTETQIANWNAIANRGLLFNNRTVSNIMLQMRTVLSGTVVNGFGLHSIMDNEGTRAITTSGDWRNQGMLELNEAALLEALERDPEKIIELFTGENGIMSRLQFELNHALNTMGPEETHGSLIRRAGLATGITATRNAIFDRIRSTNQMIETLQRRHDKQQERFWRQFTNMERQFATLNSRSDEINGFFMGLFA